MEQNIEKIQIQDLQEKQQLKLQEEVFLTEVEMFLLVLK